MSGPKKLVAMLISGSRYRLSDENTGNIDYCLVTDAQWNNLPTINGWAGVAGNLGQYRVFPDGTLRLKGCIFKTAVPVGGEQIWSGLPAVCRPSEDRFYHTSCRSRADNGQQKIIVQPGGTAVIWEFSAGLSGDCALDGISWPLPRLG